MTDKRKRADGIPEPMQEDRPHSGWQRPDDEAAVGEGAPQEEPAPAEADQVQLLTAEAADLKERLLRALADTENLRKRAERERAEASLYAATNFARDLLSVADSMDRALQSVPQEGREELSENTRNLLAGIEVTQKELLNVFSRHGITRIEPMGEKFDPHFHQAMFEVPDASAPAGTVVQVVQAGYVIGERCLRPALVGISKAIPADSSGLH